jgi:hypothetical protein
MVYAIYIATKQNYCRAREFHVDERKEIKKTNGKAEIRRPNQNELS